MHIAIFKLSPKAKIFISILVAGLLVFVYLHWQGQRHTELIVFLVLTALAMTLYTIRGEVSLEPAKREVTARRRWLGWPVRHVVIRLGINDELFLKDDVTHSQKGSGIHVAYDLEASGKVVSHNITEPGPYLVISEGYARNKAALVAFARQAAEVLRVPLHDSRRYK
jgi:hypothetical protein